MGYYENFGAKIQTNESILDFRFTILG
jgi:hypothetical protein